MTRSICIITGSRAEYSHQKRLAKEINEDPRLSLSFIVTGSHLQKKYGETWTEIKNDGFNISAKVPIQQADDTPTGITNAIGCCISGVADALAQINPDLLVILGDRYEMLAASTAALVMRIPIAHLHGGESTQGAFDEAIRHSITKMANLHFTATASYSRRVIQLGEDPARVFNVGAPGLDAINDTPLMDLQELSDSIGFNLGQKYFIVTYHPATLSDINPANGITAILTALQDFPAYKILITGVNADTGNTLISEVVSNFATANAKRTCYVISLGHHRYLSALKHAAVAIGNSSSGLIEAPALYTPTVDIGDRQTGRLCASSVLRCKEDEGSIKNTIQKALDYAFLKKAFLKKPPYGYGGASKKIKDIIADIDLNGLLIKSFHDVEFKG